MISSIYLGPLSLNGNTFVISNKKYHHANLAQWGTNVGEVGTREVWGIWEGFLGFERGRIPSRILLHRKCKLAGLSD